MFIFVNHQHLDVDAPITGDIGASLPILDTGGDAHFKTDELPEAREIVTQEGFVTFIREHHVRLIRFFMRRRLRLEDAQDLAQETVLALWKRRQHIDPPHLKIMFGIAWRLYYTFLSSRPTPPADLEDLAGEIEDQNQAHPYADNDASEFSTEHPVTGRMLVQCDALTQKQRKVIQLVYIKGLSMQEAADKLGVNKCSVQTHARRGIKLLKSFWNSKSCQ